jgi:hypothetical protein
MRHAVSALLTLLLIHPIHAQLSFDPVSRAAGGVWLREGGDPWCAVSAPPLLRSVQAFGAGFAHFPSAWGLGPLTSSAAAAAMPAGPGVVGVSLTRFGSDLYCETEGGIAWGASAGALLYGAALRLRHLSIERYGSAWTPRVDLAAAVATAEWFLWGVRVTDVNRGPVGRSGERLRQGIAIAAAFIPRGLPGLFLQAENDGGSGFSVRAGVSLDVRTVSVRAGTSDSFTRIHAGFALPAGRFVFGYGIVAHPVLGWSHGFWLSAGGDR